MLPQYMTHIHIHTHLRVVPRGASHHAPVQVGDGRGDDLVVGAPQLEGEDGLQVLALLWGGGVVVGWKLKGGLEVD